MTAGKLTLEIAIALSHKQKLSTGQAPHLADLNLIEFPRELARRGLCIDDDVEDLQPGAKALRELGQ